MHGNAWRRDDAEPNYRYRTFAAGVRRSAASVGQDDKKVPPLNAKVLEYCVSQKGKQVGNGECWTLADEALGAAGAHRPGRDGYALYVYGRALQADEQILPGDIVQFNDAKFVKITETKESFVSMKLHTGIVAKVDGTRIEMLNQNIRGFAMCLLRPSTGPI